jgi:hypothetical protein
VKSFFDLKVNFTDPLELAKVFIVKNVGYIKEKPVKPANLTTIPWNLALNNQFVQQHSWDIYNYPSNYRSLYPNRTIYSGQKSLTFDKIQKKKDGAASGAAALTQVKTSFQEDQKLSQSLLISNSTKKLAKKLKKQNDNEGAAVFTFKDNSTGLSQQFAFNLRYYVGAFQMNKTKSNSTNGTLLAEHRQDGMYEFSVNGTSGLQKSFKYGQISVKRSRLRRNENSSEFLLIWEQNYTKSTNASKASSAVQSHNNTIGDAGLLSNGSVPKGKKYDDTLFN